MVLSFPEAERVDRSSQDERLRSECAVHIEQVIDGALASYDAADLDRLTPDELVRMVTVRDRPAWRRAA